VIQKKEVLFNNIPPQSFKRLSNEKQEALEHSRVNREKYEFELQRAKQLTTQERESKTTLKKLGAELGSYFNPFLLPFLTNKQTNKQTKINK